MVSIINLKKFRILKVIICLILCVTTFMFTLFIQQQEVQAFVGVDDAALLYIIAMLLMAAGVFVTSDQNAMESFYNGTGQLYSLAKSIEQKVVDKGFEAVAEAQKLIDQLKNDWNKNDDDPNKPMIPYPLDNDPNHVIPIGRADLSHDFFDKTGVGNEIKYILQDDEKFVERANRYNTGTASQYQLADGYNMPFGDYYPDTVTLNTSTKTLYNDNKYIGGSNYYCKTLYISPTSTADNFEIQYYLKPKNMTNTTMTTYYYLNQSASLKTSIYWYEYLDGNLLRSGYSLDNSISYSTYPDMLKNIQIIPAPLYDRSVFKIKINIKSTSASGSIGIHKSVFSDNIGVGKTEAVLDSNPNTVMDISKTKTVDEVNNTKLPSILIVPQNPQDIDKLANKTYDYNTVITNGNTLTPTLPMSDLLRTDEAILQENQSTNDYLSEITNWTRNFWDNFNDSIGNGNSSSSEPDLTDQTKNYRIPDLFLLILKVILACIRMNLRALTYIITLEVIPSDSWNMNSNIVAGIDFFRNQNIPYINISIWNAVTSMVTVVFGLSVIKRVRRLYSV